jgi:hypothetical protein
MPAETPTNSMERQNSMEVASLWIGDSLPEIAQLAAKSFLDHGFRFRLFTYGDVKGVPSGVILDDASRVLSKDEVFRHHTGSYAPAADWFRYRYLNRHGGIWTDMDLVCLRPFEIDTNPWYAWESDKVVAIGLLAFSAQHQVLHHMENLAADPASAVPWDTEERTRAKLQLKLTFPDVRDRRITVPWGVAGPSEFTRALAHFDLLRFSAPSNSIYPVHYSVWRHAYDGTLGLEDSKLEDSWAIHLWGDLLRREPDAMHNLSNSSIVAGLMKRHGIEPPVSLSDSPQPPVSTGKILVGICSARPHLGRRAAVRETWMSRAPKEVECFFFVGKGDSGLEGTDDVWDMDAPDDYDHLPLKVIAFFTAALKREFDWLFKCDDDTYVLLDRLLELRSFNKDLVGNEFVESRGSPSGGAGYLLSRRLVELLVSDNTLPRTGAEDVVVGNAARRYGASCQGTNRLCWDQSRAPSSGNNVITSHWCSAKRLRAVHEMFHETPEIVQVVHRHWRDGIKLYPRGAFARCSSNCAGTWTKGQNGVIHLEWFDWPWETLVPDGKDGEVERYRCAQTAVRNVHIELWGGMGNQMFQYAHTLALARKIGADLKLTFTDYGRPFALHYFGLKLDAPPHAGADRCHYEGDYDERKEWPTLAAARSSGSGCMLVRGYFQSEGFFRPVSDEVRHVFQIQPMIPDGIEGRTPVCVHVRRGDFLRSSMHSVCQNAYYQDAVRVIRALVANPCFLVLSDDPDWCRRFFGDHDDVRVMDAMDEFTTLRVMCACKAFVLSNSTFGWWGAWLSQAQPVVAPRRFLAGTSWNICPDSWILIPPEGA